MQQTERKRYRDKLDALAARLQDDVDATTEDTRRSSGGQAAGELSNVPLHLGDMGTDEFLQERDATLMANEQYLIEEVRAALRRIDEGTFGRCLKCGAWIAKARLDALPYARHCVKCAESEKMAPVANLEIGRPQSPAETLAPEGEMGEDRLSRRRPSPPVPDEPQVRVPEHEDAHAAGTAGGGTAVGGLAGSPAGHGDPDVASIDDATGSGNYDSRDARPPL